MGKAIDSIKTVLANSANYGGTREADAIEYLVYHYTGNDGDSDANNAAYYAREVIKASAHYFVDDDSITRSVPDLCIAWAIGGGKYKSCAETGGGKLYGKARNYNSISIEMCDTRRDGTYNVTEATLQNAIDLGRMLMKRYNIPIERVIRHFDVTGKPCPAYFVDDARWEAFRARLTENDKEEKDMLRYNSMDSINERAPWASETVEKLIRMGVIRGGGSTDSKGRPADMDLSHDMLRLLVFIDRAGAFDK